MYINNQANIESHKNMVIAHSSLHLRTFFFSFSFFSFCGKKRLRRKKVSAFARRL